MIINLAPHSVIIEGHDPINPSGSIARVKENVSQAPSIDGIPCTYQEWGEVIDLPDYQEGIFYIVSLPVWNALPDRKDLLLAGQQVRDAQGRIIGCKSLVRR